MASTTLLFSVLTALNFLCIAFAFDPRPLQDFCVADPTSTARVNGLPCKDPTTVKVEDFLFRGLNLPGNSSADVTTVPGLNTLGVTLSHFDIAPGGLVPPHYHPRATEVITILQGWVEAGFVKSGPNGTHYSTYLTRGDVFVFPVGLLHYFRNVGKTNIVVLAAYNSQNPGITEVTGGVFGVEPPINDEYLAKAYKLDRKTVHRLQAGF